VQEQQQRSSRSEDWSLEESDRRREEKTVMMT
jgi:hypothetical protein